MGGRGLARRCPSHCPAATSAGSRGDRRSSPLAALAGRMTLSLASFAGRMMPSLGSPIEHGPVHGGAVTRPMLGGVITAPASSSEGGASFGARHEMLRWGCAGSSRRHRGRTGRVDGIYRFLYTSLAQDSRTVGLDRRHIDLRMKEIVWIGSSLADLTAFPPEARRKAGFELRSTQRGEMPSDFKPMTSIGPGVIEVRIRARQAFRVFLSVTFPEAIYVLHAFEKRSQKTGREDLAIGRLRFRRLLELRTDNEESY